MSHAPFTYPDALAGVAADSPTSASSTNDLLLLTGFATWSKADRWRLIDLIEQRIDYVQTCQRALPPNMPTYQFMSSQLQALRLKRFSVWNSFYPKFAGVIQAGVSAAAPTGLPVVATSNPTRP